MKYNKSSLAKFLVLGGVLSAAGISIQSAQAAVETWVGSAGSTDWNQSTWTGTNPTPLTGDSLVFTSANASASTTLTDTLTSSSFNIAGITFNSGALAYTMTGNDFALTGNILNSSTSLETINNAISMTAVRTVTMTTGGGNVTLGGNISGTGGGLTTAGTGTLTLSGTNSYTGTTTVGATGKLVFQGSAAMSSSSALSTATGATISLLSDTDATFTAASWGPPGGSTTTLNVGPASTGSGNSLTLSIAPVTFVGSTNMTFNVTGSGGDRLIFSGGDLQFTSTAGSTLTLNPTTANLTVSKNINQPNSGKTGTLKLDGTSASNLFSGNITNGTGTTAVTKQNTSTWTLSGTNTYSGTTSITGGTLVYRGASAMSSNSNLSPATGATISLLSDTDATFTAAGFGPSGGATVTLNVGPISTGSGNSLTLSSSAVTFVGANSMTFNVTGSSGDRLILSGGDLTLTNNANQSLTLNPTTANLTVTKNFNGGNNPGTLTLDGTSTSNLFSGNITNAASAVSVIKSNSSTWTLSGTNTYVGTTTINAGTLQLGNGGTTGSLSTSSAITDNGTFAINRSNAVAQGTDFSGSAISGSGGLTQAGAGTTTLNAANTYTGATTINAGTLKLSNALAVQNSSAVSISGGTLQGTVNVSIGGNLSLSSGTLDIRDTGAGAFSLASDQAFSMTGGTWLLNITDISTFDSITSLGGGTTNTFTVGGTLDLTGSTLAAGSYDILTNFKSGSGSFAGITGYDSGAFTVAFNITGGGTTGTLSITAVPEPQEFAVAIVFLLGVLVVTRRRQRDAL